MSEASSQPLSIDISFPVEGTALVELVGELEVVSVEEFSVRMADLDGGGRSHVVIDVAGITFIDSSGINALIRAVRSVEARGGTAVVASPSAVAQRVFAITLLPAARAGRAGPRRRRSGWRRRGTRSGARGADDTGRRGATRGRKGRPRSGARRSVVPVPPPPRRRRDRHPDGGRRRLGPARAGGSTTRRRSRISWR